MFKKNYQRDDYSFANINLLGKCNANCYFCLGKDLIKEFSGKNHIETHFNNWKNFNKFLDICNQFSIKNIYITGQNTDSLMYFYLEEIIDFLQENNFDVGLRTNGILALDKIDIINKCNRRIGYSIHSLWDSTNKKIGLPITPNWNEILEKTHKCRVSIVINRYNHEELSGLITFLSKFKNVKYIQVRCVSTDKREDLLFNDARIFNDLLKSYQSKYEEKESFKGASRFIILNKEVIFWKTIATNANSINYFTDGIISKQYFIVKGYLEANNENNFMQLWKMGMKHQKNGFPGWQMRFCIKKKRSVYFASLPNLQCWNCKEFVCNEGVCDPL